MTSPAETLTFLFYLVAKASLYVSAITFFVSGLDDVLFDVYYLVRQGYRRLFVYRKHARLTEQQLLDRPEQPLAVFVPAWQEGDVIGPMLLNTLTTLDYDHYHIFVGTYPNDDATALEVEKVRQLYANVTRVVCPEDGPTSKADNLNWIYQGMLAFEEAAGVRFAAAVIHDSEDIVHPLSLKLYNYLVPRFAMVQLPVHPLECPLHNLTAGIYLDEFAENHSKDLLVRERLDGCIPAAGVGCAFAREALETMAGERHNRLFNTSSLTEDYEFGMRLRRVPGRKIFVRQPLERVLTRPDGRPRRRTEIIATREFFPARFRDAVRQRARWTLGIAIQGWRSLGWQGRPTTKLMLYRDRKVLVTGLVTAFAYVAFLYFLADVACRRWLGYTWFPPLVRGESWILTLLVVDLVLMFQRLVFRVAFVSRLFGVGHGLMSMPRVVWANLVNFCATARAVRQFLWSRLTGTPISWAKTSHRYPSEAQLKAYRRKLGDLLLEKRFITVQQLDRALAVQRDGGARLGDVLLELGFLEEEDLQQVLAKQQGVPFAPVDPYRVELTLLQAVPQDVCRREQLFPLRREGGPLVLATSRLDNFDRLQTLGEALGEELPVQLVLGSGPDLDFALRRGFQRADSGSPTPDRYLGERLLAQQLIDASQLESALRLQKRTDGRLGDILVAQGVLRREQLEQALAGRGDDR